VTRVFLPTMYGLSVTPIIDNYRYFIDFGDGTISDALTADHYYKYPGEYEITLVAVDSATNFYRSEQRPSYTSL
jgi:PKD repeat protein